MSGYLPGNSQGFVKKETARLRTEVVDLYEEVQQYKHLVSSLASLYDATDNFKDDKELLPFLKTTLDSAMKLLNAPDGSLALLDDEKHELVFVIVNGSLSGKLTNHRMPADEGVAGWVIKNAKPTLVRNVKTDPRFYTQVDTDFTFRTQSIAAAPLLGGQKVFGLVEILNQPGNSPFSDQDLALLKLFCRAAGDALAHIERLPPTGPLKDPNPDGK